MTASGRGRGRWAAAAMAALAISGCGGAERGDEVRPRGPTFVQADVDFAIHMGQHHAQSLEMAEPARTKARSGRVRALAAEISATYADEIDVLAGWTTTWAEAGATMPPHGLDGHSFPGMMKAREIDGLRTLTGTSFDQRFLALMTRHQRAALTLARHETAEGANPEALDLAGTIQAAAARRVAEMQSIRASLR